MKNVIIKELLNSRS